MNSLRNTTFLLLWTACCGSHVLSAEQPKSSTPPDLPAGVQFLPDLAYVKDGQERHRLDLYLPEKIDKPLPVIVWIHGGAWLGGNKEGCAAVWLVPKGYAVASINYRLSTQAAFPAQIQDCKAAIRWLRAHAEKYHLDPDHIGVWGASAGGYLVALLGVTGDIKTWDGDEGGGIPSSRVQAVIDWFGPTDFTILNENERKDSEPLSKLLGGVVSDDAARRASPITYVDKNASPFLIMHGDKDEIVASLHSERFAEALKSSGVEVQLEILHESQHGGPEFSSPERLKRIETFFDRHLKNAKTPAK